MTEAPPIDQHGIPIAQLSALIDALGPEQFLANHPAPFLLTLGDLAEVHDGAAGEMTQIETPRGLMGALSQSSIIPDTAVAWSVRKQHATFPAKITLGRSPNNDLAIPHRSISKFHAFFSEKPDGFYLAEAGSKNASRHNGVRITTELKPRLLRDEDVVQFGAGPEMLFVKSETLIRLLREKAADESV